MLFFCGCDRLIRSRESRKKQRDVGCCCCPNGYTVNIESSFAAAQPAAFSNLISNKKTCKFWGYINFLSGFSFNVPQKGCGTVSQSGYKTANVASNTFQRSLDTEEQEVFLENTIVIQHDPDFQEAGDTARRLRCVWGVHSLQKSVNAKMPQVYQPSTVIIG